MKPLSDAQYAFKAAVRRAVTMCGGPNAAAEFTRVDAARLSRYGNIDCPEFAPIDVCFALDLGAGKPVIFNAWAELGQADQLAHDMTLLVADLAPAIGQLIHTVIKAEADGQTSINEAKDIDNCGANAADTIVDIRAAARRKMSSS